MVVAKFQVNQVASSNNVDEYFTISLSAVTSGSEENKEFFKWTPNGSITLQTVNPAAAAQFTEGKEVYVQFLVANEVVAETASEDKAPETEN